MLPLTSHQLQTYFREHRDLQNYPENFRLRIHRALSWLKKAENSEDLDTKFISLWISFNAAYAENLKIISVKIGQHLMNFYYGFALLIKIRLFIT